MKKLVLTTLCLLIVTVTFAQKKRDSINIDYKRSSLCLFLMEEDVMPNKSTIIDAFKRSPFPNKFNEHNVGSSRIINADYINITDEDIALLNENVELSQKRGDNNFNIGNQSKVIFATKAYKHILENDIPKQLFDKWFLDSDGNFCTKLIQERGLYNASVMDIENAKSSARGLSTLQDAGEELINNTFVVVCRYQYVDKDELVAVINATMEVVSEASDNVYVSLGARVASLAATASIGSGYYVLTTSHLFQLEWNEGVANTLFSECWDNKEKYEASDIFNVKYIGNENAWAKVKAGIFTEKSDDELTHIATVNATDAVLTKLQKRYDVFKTKTPIMVDENGLVTAHIGLKEDLKNKDKFEVLEVSEDEDSGKTIYRRKGVISVSGKAGIWDNTYMADLQNGYDPAISYTTFRAPKKHKYYTGMLIRQIK